MSAGDAKIDPKAVVEAVLFASAEPLEESELQAHLEAGPAVGPLLEALRAEYATRGVRLEKQGARWAFRTAPELRGHLTSLDRRPRKLSRAALETLAIIAYQQPVTRAEIEQVRGVPVARGTLDILLESGWVAPKGRREAPGRPVTWVTTPAFLDHFQLASLDDLPRLDEIEAAGLFRPVRDEGAGQEARTREDDADDDGPPAAGEA